MGRLKKPMTRTNEPETDQEAFWRGPFGDDYTHRNASDSQVRSNLSLFSRILRRAPSVRSIVELGCNRGLNLQAIHALNPEFRLSAYEINERAAESATKLAIAEIHCQSILELDLDKIEPSDLSFTKGVLIHINPEKLPLAYEALYHLSNRYIFVCEYYNPTPTTVSYRGTTETLFKRDFAGELIDRFKLTLVDYGFVYHRDGYFPLDDCTWFLLEKR
jgi:spore coat polysaccharide biosynthesis protein SpsF